MKICRRLRWMVPYAFEIASLVNVPGHYLRKYGIQVIFLIQQIEKESFRRPLDFMTKNLKKQIVERIQLKNITNQRWLNGKPCFW